MLWPDHNELRVTILLGKLFMQWGLVVPFSRNHEAVSLYSDFLSKASSIIHGLYNMLIGSVQLLPCTMQYQVNLWPRPRSHVRELK